MIGNAETLREKLKARADLKQLCDSIIFAGERGAELTHRLLAFSRRQLLQPTEVDCNQLVERNTAHVQPGRSNPTVNECAA